MRTAASSYGFPWPAIADETRPARVQPQQKRQLAEILAGTSRNYIKLLFAFAYFSSFSVKLSQRVKVDQPIR